MLDASATALVPFIATILRYSIASLLSSIYYPIFCDSIYYISIHFMKWCTGDLVQVSHWSHTERSTARQEWGPNQSWVKMPLGQSSSGPVMSVQLGVSTWTYFNYFCHPMVIILWSSCHFSILRDPVPSLLFGLLSLSLPGSGCSFRAHPGTTGRRSSECIGHVAPQKRSHSYHTNTMSSNKIYELKPIAITHSKNIGKTMLWTWDTSEMGFPWQNARLGSRNLSNRSTAWSRPSWRPFFGLSQG